MVQHLWCLPSTASLNSPSMTRPPLWIHITPLHSSTVNWYVDMACYTRFVWIGGLNFGVNSSNTVSGRGLLMDRLQSLTPTRMVWSSTWWAHLKLGCGIVCPLALKVAGGRRFLILPGVFASSHPGPWVSVPSCFNRSSTQSWHWQRACWLM